MQGFIGPKDRNLFVADRVRVMVRVRVDANPQIIEPLD